MAKKKVEKESLSEIMERLNKTYGVGAIQTLKVKSPGDYETISTGSIGFDWDVLGIGGIAKGKLYELIGWEGTGKSTICAHLAANCQKKGGTVVYIDGEHAVDTNYFKTIGVDVDKMLLSQPSFGEEGFNIAMETIKSGEVDLVIIDSDSSLIPKKVVDGDVGDSAIGRKALLNSNAYPKLKTQLCKHNTAVVVISQYREKIGVMFGDPRTTQGGHALKFYSDCRIEISKTLSKNGQDVVGNETKIRAIKNKIHPPYQITKFDIIFGLGIDKHQELLDLASEFKIGRKYGSTYTFNDIKYDLGDFINKLDDIEFFEDLRNQVIDKILTIEVEEEQETENEL